MNDNWKMQLRREASAHHMCAENRRALEAAESKKEAIRLYKKTIDWALEEGFPAFDTLRNYFSDCGDYGIYVGKHFHGEALMDHKVYVFHNCTGVIRTGLNVKAKIIPMLYFANDCSMTVKPAGPTQMEVRVPLYVFGENRIIAENSEDIVCKVYKFAVK